MNYHDIVKQDLLNGEDLGVALFVSGCSHNCHNCHNPQTHPKNSGILFDEEAKQELLTELDKPWCKRITYVGGNPTEKYNLEVLTPLAKEIKEKYPSVKQWLYSGDLWEQLKFLPIIQYLDVLIDGEYIEELADIKYPYAGSTNQRVIDVQKSLCQDEVVLWKSKYNHLT